MQDGCLLFGSRVIVPPPGRDKVMTLLHEGHPGVVQMKGLARSYVWWPRMDAELEGEDENDVVSVNNITNCHQ